MTSYSGVFIEHPEFEGRARLGISTVENETGDGYGHGTLVAGLIGSKTYGVAKKVMCTRISVRFLLRPCRMCKCGHRPP